MSKDGRRSFRKLASLLNERETLALPQPREVMVNRDSRNRDVSSASQRSFFGRPFLALSDRSEARYVTHGSSNYLSESCPRIGDVPKSPLPSNWQPWCR